MDFHLQAKPASNVLQCSQFPTTAESLDVSDKGVIHSKTVIHLYRSPGCEVITPLQSRRHNTPEVQHELKEQKQQKWREVISPFCSFILSSVLVSPINSPHRF